MQRLIQSLLLSVIVIPGVVAVASTTGILPAGVCAYPDTIYVHGFEAQSTRYVEPSNGSGGAARGGQRFVTVPGFGSKKYYSYVPFSYSPSRAMPMLLLLHGRGGPGTADNAANALIQSWSPVAESAQIIIVAAVGSSQDGSFIVPPGIAITDYDVFRAIFADMKSAYNVDGSRIHGWGYSSGGSVMNDLVFGPNSPGINIDTFAGLGNWAGGLDGLTCFNKPEATCMQIIAAAPRMLPIDLHVGSDDTASLPHVMADYNRFQNAGWVPEFNLWYRETPNGHEYNTAYFPEIWDHLCPFQRLP